MRRHYSWDEIKEFLVKELKKTKYIMTWGTIGSCNVEHDIDTIITKKPESKTSDFYREIHRIFSALNEYLSVYDTRVIKFSSSSEEYFIRALSGDSNRDLFFHTMIYTSHSQMIKDWQWAMFPDDSIDEIILKNYSCLLGSVDQIFSESFRKEKYYYSIYNFIYLYDKINSFLPKKVFLDTMNHSFDYLYRKRLGLKAPVAKNVDDVKKYFYKLCDEVDRLEKIKSPQ